MSEPKYSFTVEWSDEDECFVALCPEFPGLSAFGDTHEEAVREGMVALGLMVEVVKGEGEPLPEPRRLIFGKAKAERAVLSAAEEWHRAEWAFASAMRADGVRVIDGYRMRCTEAAAALRKATDDWLRARGDAERGGEG